MSEDLQILLREAETLYEQAEWEQAQEKYLKILQRDPQNEEACYKIATIYSIRGLISNVVNQYFQLMDILEAKGDLDQAVEVAKWIQRIQPDNDKARMKIIVINKKKGNIDEVVKQSLQLARLYIELGQGDQSIILLQGAQEYAPANLDIGLELAEMYMSHGHIQEAAQQYRKIANAYLEKGQYEKAADAFRRMKVIVSDDEQLLLTLGNIYVSLNRFNEAEAEFRAVLRLDLNNVEALMALGNVCQLKGQFRDAILAFNKILSINPQEVKAKEKLGELHQAQGNHIESIKNYLSAAHIYQSMEETDRAIRLYQRVLTLDPTNPTACRELTNLGAPLVGEEEEEVSAYQPSILPIPELMPGRVAEEALREEPVMTPPPQRPSPIESRMEESMITTRMPSRPPAEALPTFEGAQLELPSLDDSPVMPSLDDEGMELPSLDMPSMELPTFDDSPLMSSMDNSTAELPSLDMPSMVSPMADAPSFEMPPMASGKRGFSQQEASSNDAYSFDTESEQGEAFPPARHAEASYGTPVSPGFTGEEKGRRREEREDSDEEVEKSLISKREKYQERDTLVPKKGLGKMKQKGLAPKAGKKGGFKPRLGADEEDGEEDVRPGLMTPKGKGPAKPRLLAGKKETPDRPVSGGRSQSPQGMFDDEIDESTRHDVSSGKRQSLSPFDSPLESIPMTRQSLSPFDSPLEPSWNDEFSSPKATPELSQDHSMGDDLLMPPFGTSLDSDQILMPSPDDLTIDDSPSMDMTLGADDLLEPPDSALEGSQSLFLDKGSGEQPFDLDMGLSEQGKRPDDFGFPSPYPDISMPSIDIGMPQVEPFESMPLEQEYDIPSGKLQAESPFGFPSLEESPMGSLFEKEEGGFALTSESMGVPVSFWEDTPETLYEEASGIDVIRGEPLSPGIVPASEVTEESFESIDWTPGTVEEGIQMPGEMNIAADFPADGIHAMDEGFSNVGTQDWQVPVDSAPFREVESEEKKEIFIGIDLPPVIDEPKISQIEVEILKLRDILEAGDYSSAIETYEKILASHPANIELRTELADLYFTYGLIDEALSQFKILAEKDPHRVDYLQKLATLHLWEQHVEDAVSVLLAIARSFKERNEIPLALEYFQGVLSLDRDNMEAREEIVDIYLEQEAIRVSLYHLNILANLAIERREPEKAIHLLKKIYVLTSDIVIKQRLAEIYEEYGYGEESINEYILLAGRYKDLQDYQRACACLEKVVEIHPENLDAHYQLIELYEKIGDRLKSMEEKYQVATIYLKAGEKDEALTILEEILKARTDHHEARHRLIDVYLEKGMIERAFEEAQVLSDVYFREKKVDQAIELYQKLVAADPDNLVLRERLAHFYMMNDRAEEALKEVLNIADCLFAKGEWDEAIKTYRKALQIDDRNADVRHQLAMILLDRKGNRKDALIELQRVFDMAPEHRENTKKLIHVLLQEGRPEEAIKVLDKFISIDPKNEVMKGEIINSYLKKIEENQEDVQSRFFIGIIYKELRMLDDAIEQFQKTKRIDEYFLQSSNMLAMCFTMKPGMQQIAVRTLKKAVETTGFSEEDKTELRYNLGVLLESTNKPQEALAQYQDIYKTDITFRDVAQRIKQLKEQLAGGPSKVTRLVAREPGE